MVNVCCGFSSAYLADGVLLHVGLPKLVIPRQPTFLSLTDPVELLLSAEWFLPFEMGLL